MSFLRRKLVKFVLIPIVLLLLLIGFLPAILSTSLGRGAVEKRIGEALGTKAAIGDLDVSWTSGIAITDLAIDNPEGFSTEKFLTAASIEVRPALVSTMRGRTNVSIVIKDARVRIERAADGRLNTDVLAGNASKGEPSEEEDSDGDAPLDLVVRIEGLSVDYVDHADGKTQTVENVTLDLQISGDRPEAYAGELKLAADRILGVPFFEPQRIELAAKGEGGNWQIEHATVPLSDGAVSLSGTVGFAEQTFKANIDLSNVSIGSDVPGLGRVLPIFQLGGETSASGLLDANVELFGDSFELSGLGGEGSVSIGEASLSGNPIVEAILQLSGGAKTLKFDRLETKFELLPGLDVTTTPVQVKGGDVDFEIGGTVRSDGALDYILSIRPKGRDWEKVRKLLGSNPLQVPVKGTLSSPEVQMPDPGTILEGLLKGALEDGVRKGLGDIFKDR